LLHAVPGGLGHERRVGTAGALVKDVINSIPDEKARLARRRGRLGHQVLAALDVKEAPANEKPQMDEETR
jgi:Xaa-Pro aminopeptidase